MNKLKSLKQYREENGLGDLKPDTDVSGVESELISDTIEIIRHNSEKLRRILMKAIGSEDDPNFEHDLKKLMGLISNLKNGPKEKKKSADPLSDVVARPFAGPDASGDNNSSGQ